LEALYAFERQFAKAVDETLQPSIAGHIDCFGHQ
jgi:phytoene/squalene synthetase